MVVRTLPPVPGGAAPCSAASHRRRALVESALASVAVAAIVVISLLGLWRASEEAILEGTRGGLIRLAVATASTIDPSLHAAGREAPSIHDERFDLAVSRLRRAHQAMPDVRRFYTLVDAPPRFQIVLEVADDVDGGPGALTVRAAPAHREPTIDAELLAAAGRASGAGSPAASRAPHLGAHGAVMTGYAPIVDESGRQVGVLCVDVDAAEYESRLASIHGEVLMGFIPGATLTAGVGIGVFLLRRRQLASLRAAEAGERRALHTAQRLAESERRFRTLADSAPMLVWSADAEGRCDFVNRPWSDFVGRPADLEMGEGWIECVHPDDREATRAAYWRAFQSRRMFLAEYRLRRHDGEYRLILDRGTPRDEDGVFAGFIGAGLDVTEMRRAERELQYACAAAQDADRAKSEFLANMSHEMRTPLTTILGYAEVLRTDGDAELAPPGRLQALDAIHSAGAHLLTLINDVLDLSKIEAGGMRVDRVETNLVTLLRNCVDLMRVKADEKRLALRVELGGSIPDRVITDPTRLRQVILNLLSNAVKFTTVGAVTLRVAAEREMLIIGVEDTGIGLSPEQASRLFTPFTQADQSISRNFGGTGLGLAICHRMAILLGGGVALDRSAPGCGSLFTLHTHAPPAPGARMIDSLALPSNGARASDGTTRGVNEGASVHGGAAGPPAPRAAPCDPRQLSGRVLLVEDGIDNRRLIALHLDRAGAVVVTAENGRVALERIDESTRRGERFDLVVTDMQMPEMDGITLVRTLRARRETMPIIALTAHAMTEERDRCLEAGCNDFASKPIDRASLLAVCGAWLDVASRSRAA